MRNVSSSLPEVVGPTAEGQITGLPELPRPGTGKELDELEALLFSKYETGRSLEESPVVFILGSPRTGSTFLYLAMLHAFSFTYFSNLANDAFPTRPVIEMALRSQLTDSLEISLESRYGKTQGLLRPSEASFIWRNWYGGEHPSQAKSSEIIRGKRSHMLKTLASCTQITRTPIVIKNAWNCFRIQSLSRLLPRSFFIWIRRDIVSSSSSDLSARYAVQKSPNVWNSATPSNWLQLRTRPYWEQVVENQYEFNTAIRDDLEEYAGERSLAVWYEDLRSDPDGVLGEIGSSLTSHFGSPIKRNVSVNWSERPGPKLGDEDARRLDEYVRQNIGRLSSMMYHT